MSRRCSECRARFEAAVTAAGSQRVCGAKCRKRRRARLARRRRQADLEGARAEERERQKRRRERRGGPEPPSERCRSSPSEACEGEGTTACHEPASAPKQWNFQVEILEIVDSSIRLSRATFERAMGRMERKLSRIAVRIPGDRGQGKQGGGRVSRASYPR
jgi:hypothetical protein